MKLKGRMRGRAVAGSVAGVLAMVAAPASAQTAADGPPGVEGLGWLAGCWVQRTEAMVIEEQWTAPGGGTLLGVSRTTRAGSLVGWEFTRIFARGDTVVFAAQPSGQSPAEFYGRVTGGDEIEFENPAHDFPQRVSYWREGPALRARIEDVAGTRGVDFVYAPAACPSGSEPGRDPR